MITLCFQITLVTHGWARMLHSMYTSSPSLMADMFSLLPNSMCTTGTSAFKKKRPVSVYNRIRRRRARNYIGRRA